MEKHSGEGDQDPQDFRRSSRPNIGVPPPWFKDFVKTTGSGFDSPPIASSTRVSGAKVPLAAGRTMTAQDDAKSEKSRASHKSKGSDFLGDEIRKMEQSIKLQTEMLATLKSLRDDEEGSQHLSDVEDQQEEEAEAAGGAGGAPKSKVKEEFGDLEDNMSGFGSYDEGEEEEEEQDPHPSSIHGGEAHYFATPSHKLWKPSKNVQDNPQGKVKENPPIRPPRPRTDVQMPPARSLWRAPEQNVQPPQPRPRSRNLGSNPVRSNPQPPPQGGGPSPPEASPTGVDALANALIHAMRFQNQNTERFVARQSSSSNLPIFAGNPLDWPLFAHHYGQSTMDCGFSQSQNMTRLEKALRGEARAAVKSLMIIPDNADAVMEGLEQRFGRPEYVVHALIEMARKTASPKEGRLSNIVDFSNAVANLVSTVKSLQVPVHLENPQLLQELVDKLPDTMKLQWGMHSVTRGGRNLDDFSTWIMEVAEAASMVSMPKFNLKEGGRRNENTYAVVEETAGVTSSSNQSGSCVVCKKEGHIILTCDKFLAKSIDQRWAFVKEKNICFRCLRTGHGIKKCRSKATCRAEGCGRRHHTLLHGTLPRKEGDKPEKSAEVKELNATMSTTSTTILRIIVVKLYGPAGEMTANALLDEGSSVTLISDKAASKLGLVGVPDPLRIHWTDGSYQRDDESHRVDCWIGPHGEGEKFKLKRVRTVSNLHLPAQRSDFEDVIQQYGHLQSRKMKYLPGERPLILIGQPHVHLTLARDVVEADGDSPVITKTKLGWVLHGPSNGVTGQDSLFSCFHETDDDLIHNLVKESFALDSIGIVPAVTARSREDKEAEVKMKKMTRRTGERWETGLLWRKEQCILPRSRDVAYHRLMGIERKLRRNPGIKEQYHQKIRHYLDKSYAHKLSPEELVVPTDVEWYLPHFDCQHPNKPGKIRIVFDAASRASGVSLNDYLLTGPDLLKSLPGILLQVREKKIAFSGDITEMFHQIRIRKEDCPAQRFLFRENEQEEVSVFQLDVMMFGSVCSPYCAQYVKNINALEFQKQFPAAVEAIISKHYMDDYLQSVDTEKEAEQLIAEVTEVHRRGGFQIGKWVSNSKNLLAKIGAGAEKDSKDLSEWSEVPTERALGLHWNPEADMFTFRVNLNRAGKGVATGEAVPTKRAVLRLLMLVWDPLGFLGHYLIKAKILLQDLWKLKVGWDDEIPGSVEKKWILWIQDLPKLPKVKIRRCYSQDASSSPDVQLHIFADSSELGGCCVAYLRVLEKEGDIAMSFVMSKTRVAPVRPCSIPRLELHAALMASRMAKFIREHLEIKIHRAVYWTDSMTTLRWIRSEARKYQQFVAFRVGEIQENSEVGDWRWVPSKLNPADDGTREGRANLEEDARWWTGPPFLKMDECEWPTETKSAGGKVEDDSLELRREFTATVYETPKFYLPDISRFSQYLRLVRAAAWILKFLECVRNGGRKKSNLLDMTQAEVKLFARSQWEDFPKEMQLLLDGQQVPKSSPLYQLSPMLDKDGCLRMKSRLVTAKEEGVRLPIILHPKNHLTRLLMEHYHKIFAHQGEDTIRNELRQRFWIPRLRNSLRSVIRDCRICKLRKAKGQPPVMGALPDFRLQPQARAFVICGMDYFGPMEVTIGRKREKRYGVLFTCMTTRAVHLEIAQSLTTDSCIMAIRRMISRRGQPSQIHSDNGTNLRGADKELRLSLEEMDQDRMSSELTAKGIDWHFIPPSSPHMGGSWERLVRSVKSAMRVILKSRAPSEEVLQTVFTEAEAIVNSRPLTDVPVDAESPDALTPSHFLIGSSSSCQPPGQFDQDDLDLRKMWRKSQALADMFWRRWVKEYLPTLQRRQKWHENKPSVETGDVVMVLDESLKRSSWPLGVVTGVFPDKKGIVRVAEVKTAHGVYRRPVVKLGKLDIRSPDGQD